jgi:hypothetical protein
VAESLLWTKNILKTWFFTLKPYPKTLNREFNEDDICVAPSVFVKIVLPSKCDRGVSKGLSAELAGGSTW